MYFADLTPNVYGRTEPHPTILNVGWLSADHSLPRGAVDDQFVAALRRLTDRPLNLYRGSHLCEFCPRPPTILSPGGLPMVNAPPGTRGNGEIRVHPKGITYVAPTLIFHYVSVHGYRPLEPFIDAVILADGIQIDWMSPWQAVESEETFNSLQRQLMLELRELHVLSNLHPRVIGRRVDNDDVAVVLHDGRYATVHLVWPAKWWLQSSSDVDRRPARDLSSQPQPIDL